eukprot:9469465-Pyramimonas_sp.AAC.2
MKYLLGIPFEGNCDALDVSLYLILRDALCYISVIQSWGPKASPLIIRCTHLPRAHAHCEPRRHPHVHPLLQLARGQQVAQPPGGSERVRRRRGGVPLRFA